jgi:hypothetical protein
MSSTELRGRGAKKPAGGMIGATGSDVMRAGLSISILSLTSLAASRQACSSLPFAGVGGVGGGFQFVFQLRIGGETGDPIRTF